MILLRAPDSGRPLFRGHETLVERNAVAFVSTLVPVLAIRHPE